MLNNRKPCRMFFKIFKYDFIYLMKTLIWLYATLPVFATIARFSENYILSSIFNLSFTILSFSSLIFISNRFNKSMNSDEAYLYLTMPVTMGEHIFGRYLSAFACFLIFMLISLISYAIILKDNSILTIIKQGSNILIMLGLSSILMIIAFIYLCNAITQMIRKHNNLVTFGVFLINSIIYSVIIDRVSLHAESTVLNIVNLAFTAVFLTGTYFIYSKKLNLE